MRRLMVRGLGTSVGLIHKASSLFRQLLNIVVLIVDRVLDVHVCCLFRLEQMSVMVL